MAKGGTPSRREVPSVETLALTKATPTHDEGRCPSNTLPLSVRTWSGTPWRRMARARASQVGTAVARATTSAETQNLEWSSTPVTILASRPPERTTPPTMSICHSSMARERSQRL